MGQPDALDAYVSLRDRGEDPVNVAAGIHHHRLLADFVPQNATVLLKWRNRDDCAA
jgi:hypothetical protein